MIYAAYGSNLHPRRLTERIASARLIGTDFLPDWSLKFHKRSKDESGKCSIQRGSEGVHFAVFEIDDVDKEVLDGIEGIGIGYSGIVLDLPKFGQCASYIATESHIDKALLPYDWYRELVLIGACSHHFPEHYVDRIRTTLSRQDPDENRRSRMWDTVKLVSGSI